MADDPAKPVVESAETLPDSRGEAERAGSTARARDPGPTLGRYNLGKRLGAGGMGEVFAAYDPELGRTVAVKLLVKDFGIARPVAEADHAALGHLDHALTFETLSAQGGAMGTPLYMAPEQHTGGAVDARADQFSFCAALWAALYGKLPFRADTFE